MGVRLDKFQLSADNIFDRVMQAITNDSIQAKAKMYADILRNEQTTPMQRAIFWTEYVIRRKGARRMKTFHPTTLTSAFKYYCIDVIVVMLSVVSVAAVIIFKIVYFFWQLVSK